jgi:hypothetical protein
MPASSRWQDGRIFIEPINAPMLYEHKATPAEYKAGLDWAVERNWPHLVAELPPED